MGGRDRESGEIGAREGWDQGCVWLDQLLFGKAPLDNEADNV